MPKRRLDVRTIRKKIDSDWWENLYKYEQEYYRKKRRDRADYLAQQYPKKVAFKNKKKISCPTCYDLVTYKQCNGCHWIEKGTNGQYRCRREERNIYCCCEKCNAFEKERHHSMLTLHVTKVYWVDRVEEKLNESFQLHSKPRRYEIDAVIEKYEFLLAELDKC